MYNELDEQELAGRCRERDRMAMDELYRRYAARVYTLCKRYARDEDDAKDLMLDTLLQAIDKIDTYRYSGKGSLGGWICRIAINRAVDQIRRRRWRMAPLDLSAQDRIPEPTPEEMAEIPIEKLREWVSGLPELRKTVFNLYCIDGYSHKDIAGMLGISETGSTSILAKARRQLKEKIRQYLKEQDG